MRVCLSYLIVEKIRDGMSPQSACEEAIKRLMELKVRDPYDLIFIYFLFFKDLMN